MNFTLVAIVIMYKFLTNTYFYFRIKQLNRDHIKWLSGTKPTFPTRKHETISLFKRAGVQNLSTPISQPIGCNQVASFNVDVFTNFPSTNSYIYNGAIRMFYEAEGVYRQRMFDSLNPVYWIELIIYAPKKLLTYLGFDETKILFKTCNILLTFIWWSMMSIIIFFRPQLQQLIVETLGELQNKF